MSRTFSNPVENAILIALQNDDDDDDDDDDVDDAVEVLMKMMQIVMLAYNDDGVRMKQICNDLKPQTL